MERQASWALSPGCAKGPTAALIPPTATVPATIDADAPSIALTNFETKLSDILIKTYFAQFVNMQRKVYCCYSANLRMLETISSSSIFIFIS